MKSPVDLWCVFGFWDIFGLIIFVFRWNSLELLIRPGIYGRASIVQTLVSEECMEQTTKIMLGKGRGKFCMDHNFLTD